MLKKLNSLPPGRFFLLAALIVSFAFQDKSPIAGSLTLAQAGNLALQSGPTAKFEWSMPERFGTKNANNIVDFHWDPKTQTYEPSYVKPESWRVDFDACAPFGAAGNIQSYTWEILGQSFEVRDSCKFTYDRFKTLGIYPVKLTVTAQDGQTSSVQKDVNVKDYLIVSIGDSIASGEGNPDIPRGKKNGPAWVYARCHRSAKAGHAKAALYIERADPRTSVTFLSFACSGAGIKEGLTGQQKKGLRELPPQMEQVKRLAKVRNIDALLITIGANDANFSRLVAKALFKDDCSTDKGTKELFEKGLGTLEKRYADLNDEISTIFWRPKVFITQYPDIVRKRVDKFCDREPKDDRLRKIIEVEAKWAGETVIKKLNEKVSEAAAKHGWLYVDGIAETFYDHGYCAGEERWVNTFDDAKKIQGTKGCTKSSLIHCIISAGSVHPNKKGQHWYAKRLFEALHNEGVIIPVNQQAQDRLDPQPFP